MRIILFWMVCIVSIGCGEEKDVEVDTGIVGPQDMDGDGYNSAVDCNDENPNIYPDAEEQCDGLDNNCNGFVDEELLTEYFFDDDGDGFGDPDEPVELCEMDEGVVGNDQDCNDQDANIFPDADEVCDDEDNNCDGQIDEDLVYDWYEDLDGDGFGNPDTYTFDCNPGVGYVTNAGDCDDEDDSRSPLADEVCDGIDNDCNGEADDGIGPVWYIDSDNDGYGDSAGITYSCFEPAGDWATQAGDCDDINGMSYPGAVEFCDGEDNDCDGFADESGSLNEITWYLDADSDGYGDPSETMSACDQPVGYVQNSDDCNDSLDTVYLNAAELCDGQANTCVGVLNANEVDNDGDGYVECTIDSGGWRGTLNVVGGDDCDDSNTDISPTAVELCDGLINVCGASLPLAESDDDGDGYVECTIASNGWNGDANVVGGNDCDDSESTQYVGAPEICDGIPNTCNGYLPGNETDDDGDGYVECTIDPTGWKGVSSVIGGDDCDDSCLGRYVGAPEICDGIPNTCNGVLPGNETDDDGDGFVECTIAMTGWYGDQSVLGGEDCDDANETISPTALEICDGLVNVCGGSLPLVESDDDGDGYVECTIDLNGWDGDVNVVGGGDCDDSESTQYVGAPEICDGIPNTCNGYLPGNEYDDDGDGYVECTIDLNGWDGAQSVLGGQDCNDQDNTIYANANELCDGKDNDCNQYVSAPEEDNDGDGYVECTIVSSGWNGTGGVIGGNDCEDLDDRVYPFANELCDGIDNDCDLVISAPEEDNDGDGYVECTIDSEGWFGASTIIGGNDCDDTNVAISPQLVELCDGIPNSCGVLPAVEIDDDGDGYVECTIDSGGWVGSSGVVGGNDCDDFNTGVNPGSVEVCDGIDNDCINGIDDGVLLSFYFDSDGDGYGNPNSSTQSCSQPSGYVTNTGDCNDSQSLAYSGATESCDGVDNDCDGQTDEGVLGTYYVDSDGDGYGNPNSSTQSCSQPSGYVTNTGDCNDSQSLAYSGATESCDGVDNDCDGQVDEGVLGTYYNDSDGDGYGNPGSSTQSCSQPSGYVTNSNDCNDFQSLAYTGASELCDGVDNDCDGQTDEGLLGTYYVDSDGDGYGNPNSSTQSCSQPNGYVTNTGDCNDSQILAYTGATESCDSVDNDCDGQIDEGLQTTYYNDADSDGYGNTNSAVLSCSQPGGYVTNAGDCNDASSAIYPNAGEICDGLDNNCNNSVDEGVMGTYYVDNDGDGFGSTSSVQACNLQSGYATNTMDCDDSNSAATFYGSDQACVLPSCLELYNANQTLGWPVSGGNMDGYYWIQPNSGSPYGAWCDMTGGGWTRVSSIEAHTHLSGDMVAVHPAPISGLDATDGPYTRDKGGSHTYWYTFTFNASFTQFKFDNYIIKANAVSGDQSDLSPHLFTVSSWNQCYINGGHGDIGAGGVADGPIYSLGTQMASQCSSWGACWCNDCEYTADPGPYNLSGPETKMRIIWGEGGTEWEGWYPWYRGYIYLR